MKPKILLLLLVVSIGCNVFFLVGYRRAQRLAEQLKTVEGHDPVVVQRLKMTPEQEAKYLEIRRKARTEVQQIGKQNSAAIEKFWAAVAEPEPDRAAVHRLAQDVATVKRAGETVHLDALIDMLKIFNPEQREMVLRIGRNRNVLVE